MKNNLSPAAHALSVFCPSVPGSVAARSLGLSLEAKAKVKSTAIDVREVMFRKLSGTRAAGFKCTGSGGKCSELVQMENAISRQRIDIIAEKPGAHQA